MEECRISTWNEDIQPQIKLSANSTPLIFQENDSNKFLNKSNLSFLEQLTSFFQIKNRTVTQVLWLVHLLDNEEMKNKDVQVLLPQLFSYQDRTLNTFSRDLLLKAFLWEISFLIIFLSFFLRISWIHVVSF